MNRARIVPLLLACLLHAAAGASSGAAAPPLVGTTWNLEALEGQTLDGPPVTLRLEADGTLGGSDGCNRYHGRYTLDGASLRIAGELASTRMACPEPVMERANAFAQIWSAIATFSLVDDRLSLRDEAGHELASFAAGNADLAGTAWEVVGYNNGKQAVVSVLLGTRITAEFGENGRLTGNAGCNQYQAAYEAGAETIRFEQATTTRRFCAEPGGTMEQEALFLEALRSATVLRLEGDRLVLRNAEGALAVDLVRMTAPPSGDASAAAPQTRLRPRLP